MQNTECRQIVPNPEDNEGIQKLLQIMAAVAEHWHHATFKAIPKETTVAHNIKW